MEHLRKMYKLMNLVLPLKDSVYIIIGCIQCGYIDVPVLDNGKYLVRKHSQGSGTNVPMSHNHTVLNTWPCPFCPHAAPLLSWNKDRPRPITPPLSQLTNMFFMFQDIRPPGPVYWIETCYDGLEVWGLWMNTLFAGCIIFGWLPPLKQAATARWYYVKPLPDVRTLPHGIFDMLPCKEIICLCNQWCLFRYSTQLPGVYVCLSERCQPILTCRESWCPLIGIIIIGVAILPLNVIAELEANIPSPSLSVWSLCVFPSFYVIKRLASVLRDAGGWLMGWQSSSASCLVQNKSFIDPPEGKCSPEWNILAALGWIATKFGRHIPLGRTVIDFIQCCYQVKMMIHSIPIHFAKPMTPLASVVLLKMLTHN